MARFQKGQSGNPRGRPPGSKGQVTYLREKYGANGEQLLDMLYRLAKNAKTPPHTRVTATQELLARGWGRPPVELTGAGGDPLVTKVIHEHVTV